MVGMNMDGPARDQILELMKKKDDLEAQIREQNAILASNNVGMTDTLVDSEGYPRGDIDVYKIRHARHKIICMQNDHKRLMKEIERRLGEIHNQYVPHTIDNTASIAAKEQDTLHSNNNLRVGSSTEQKVFASVGHVHPGSPADLAGLLENDQIVQFGSINASNFNDITQLHNLLRHSIDQQVLVKVKRGDNVINAYVTPRPSAQTGLFGCQVIRQN